MALKEAAGPMQEKRTLVEKTARDCQVLLYLPSDSILRRVRSHRQAIRDRPPRNERRRQGCNPNTAATMGIAMYGAFVW
jgi:hypothetical protein